MTFGLKRNQYGTSALGMVFLLLVVGFAVLVGIRLTPKYLEYYSVVSALERVADEVSDSPSAESIRASLSKYWQVEMINSLSYKDIEITKNSSGYEVTADYRAEVPLFANLSLVADFSKTVMVP